MERKSVVIVDYLQIIASSDGRISDRQTIDENVAKLKRIAGDFNIVVIIISSFNRGNYMTEAGYESFKKSGGIEYSADCTNGMRLKLDNGEKTLLNFRKR